MEGEEVQLSESELTKLRIEQLRQKDEELSADLEIILDQPESELRGKAIDGVKGKKELLWKEIYELSVQLETKTGKKIGQILQAPVEPEKTVAAKPLPSPESHKPFWKKLKILPGQKGLTQKEII